MAIVIAKAADVEYVKMLDGIERKTLTYGDKTLIAEFKLGKGKELPLHSHPHEQTGYLVYGQIVLTIDGVEHDIQPGDAWTIKGDLIHGAKIIEDSIAVEVFSPVREDYIDK